MIPGDALQCVTSIKVQHYNHRSVNTLDCNLLGTCAIYTTMYHVNRVLSINTTVTVNEYSKSSVLDCYKHGLTMSLCGIHVIIRYKIT